MHKFFQKHLPVNNLKSAKKINNSLQINDNKIDYLKILSKHLFSLFNFINFFVFILVLISGKLQNALFMITVCCNTLVAITQEIRAKTLLANLSLQCSEQITILKNGRLQIVEQSTININDYIQVCDNQYLSFDGIIQQGSIMVDESLLSGESEAIYKSSGDPVYKTSKVISGSAIYRVTKLYPDNYIDGIVTQAKQYEVQQSILQKLINHIIRLVSYCILPLAFLQFIKLYQSQLFNRDEMLLRVSSQIISMIPEGLVLLSSGTLLLSIIKLAKQEVLSNHLHSLESLALCDVICFDKTGTLTTGNLVVQDIIHLEANYNDLIYSMLYQQNNQNQSSNAILKYLNHSQNISLQDMSSFDSSKKYCSAVNVNKTYYLGAYEMLAANSQYDSIIQHYYNMNMRVICLVCDHQLLSIILLKDELKTSTRQILEQLSKLKINIKIISGDAKQTLVSCLQDSVLMDCKALDCSQDITLTQDIVNQYTVFVRTTPEQKQQIIQLLQENHQVAMVGDGVNDLLALKTANTSITFKSAVTACRQLADVVLLNDNFNSLPSVINEGKHAIEYIHLASIIFLFKTFVAILLSITSLLLLKSYPFIPIQFTIISSLFIGIPAFILHFDPNITQGVQLFQNNIKQIFVVAIILVSGIVILEYTKTNLVFYFTCIGFCIHLVLALKPYNKYRLVLACYALISLLVVLTFHPL